MSFFSSSSSYYYSVSDMENNEKKTENDAMRTWEEKEENDVSCVSYGRIELSVNKEGTTFQCLRVHFYPRETYKKRSAGLKHDPF